MSLIKVNRCGIKVQDLGEGGAVLLVHGWPDTHQIWRHQAEALTASGYRVVAPDLRGFGESEKPKKIKDHSLLHHVGDLIGVMDHLHVDRIHVVGHDWGATIAVLLAALRPSRVATLTCISVGHPRAMAAAGLRQREKSWYSLLFQFQDVAERWLSENNFANFRTLSRHPDPDPVIGRFRDPDALTAGLGIYRAASPPETLLQPSAPEPAPPLIPVPTMGIWGSADPTVVESAMTGTAAYVTGRWTYERIEGAGHWPQVEKPEQINQLLLSLLAQHPATSNATLPQAEPGAPQKAIEPSAEVGPGYR
ncbi:alpha/beta fold hydrolase [Streptomyces zaomyceticus]|uniref:alpha/beta fold hydrolase n=1 Tax=Streptomyces zaomyceticus TaxID=68286 RepID=UPI0036A46BE5